MWSDLSSLAGEMFIYNVDMKARTKSRLLFTICYLTYVLQMCTCIHERYFVPVYIFHANTIHKSMGVYECIDIFIGNRNSLPNKINLYIIYTSKVSCGSGEIVRDLHFIQYVAPLVGSLKCAVNCVARGRHLAKCYECTRIV